MQKLLDGLHHFQSSIFTSPRELFERLAHGQSHCGAMKGLIDDTLVAELSAVRHWLAHAASTRRVTRENYCTLDGAALLSACVQENVLAQVENLKTHPAIAVRLAGGQLNLHGWVCNIERGEVLAFDPALGQFAHLDEAPVVSPLPANRALTVSI